MRQASLESLAKELDGHLRAIQQLLRQPMDSEIARGGLTGPQLSVLQALVRRPNLSLKQLRAELGLAHSTVSGIVDRLEARGLVESSTDPADSRVRLVRPSKVVRNYIQDVMPGLQRHPVLKALEKMKPAAREAVIGGIRLLRQAMDEKKSGSKT